MSKQGHCSICMTEWDVGKEGKDCPDCPKPLPPKEKKAEKRKR